MPEPMKLDPVHQPGPGQMKVISFNVNGLTSFARDHESNFFAYLLAEAPDVLLIQETKIQEHNIQRGWLHDFFTHEYYFSSTTKKGYSGVAAFTKREPREVYFGVLEDLRRVGGHPDPAAATDETIEIVDDDDDGAPVEAERLDPAFVRMANGEGRVLTLEFEELTVVNVYVPNSGQRLERLDFRTGVWDANLAKYMRFLARRCPVVLIGDLNVVREGLDIFGGGTQKQEATMAGFTPAERRSFEECYMAWMVDAFRALHPELREYSYFSIKGGKNVERREGCRLDYFLVPVEHKSRVLASFIRKEVFGSDHVPVGLIWCISDG